MKSLATTVNIGIIIGFAAIVGVGMLVTSGLLDGDYAREAIAYLLGGGTVYAVGKASTRTG